MRPAIWLAGSGMVVLNHLLRRDIRILRAEYAFSAIACAGLIRGRPRPGHRTRTFFMTAVKASESWRRPAVVTRATGRHREAAARWIPPHTTTVGRRTPALRSSPAPASIRSFLGSGRPTRPRGMRGSAQRLLHSPSEHADLEPVAVAHDQFVLDRHGLQRLRGPPNVVARWMAAPGRSPRSRSACPPPQLWCLCACLVEDQRHYRLQCGPTRIGELTGQHLSSSYRAVVR